MKYRSKPTVIEAVPVSQVLVQAALDPDWSEPDLPLWVQDGFDAGILDLSTDGEQMVVLSIRTAEGVVIGTTDHMLIRGTAGELYPCRLDVFETKYEPAPVTQG